MRAILALPIVLMATSAVAGGVDMDYENFQKTSTGAVEIVLKFTNNSGRDVSLVMADCALLNASQKAVTVRKVAARNIASGQAAYGNAFGPTTQGIEKAECRVVTVDY